jgi:membrane carboxypeptidase/penicillin-binding protein PbpC
VSYAAGNGQIYSPHNYDHKFEGAITLRWALEESRNVPAIKMMDTLGPKNARLRQTVRLRGRVRRIRPSRSAPATARCSR